MNPIGAPGTGGQVCAYGAEKRVAGRGVLHPRGDRTKEGADSLVARRWLHLSVLALALLVSATAQLWADQDHDEDERALADLHYVFLFDVSGSMRRTLGYPGSAARQYISQHLFLNPEMFLEGRPVSIYTFTTRCRREFSGVLRHSTIQDLLLTGLPISHENTDLVETLRAAQGEFGRSAKGSVTLAWILTDNVNDPAGTGADDINTRAFYAAMFQQNAQAQRMYFFPLKDYKLVLYLLVFAPDSSLKGMDIDRFEDRVAGFARALGAPKIRAKPVGGESPLEFDPHITFTGDDSGVIAELVGTGRRATLVIRGLREDKPLSGKFRLRVRSRFDEWRIEHATVEMTRLDDLESGQFPNLGGKMSARLSPSGVTVDPRSASSIVYTLDLGNDGQIPKAPFFEPAAFNPDGFGVVTGKLVMKIGDPKLTLKIFNDEATTQAVQSIFQLKDIEYFVPRSAAGKEIRLDLAVPVRFEVRYNYLPRWLALIGTTLLLGGCAVWLLQSSHKAVQCRLVGYQEDSFALTHRGAFPISPAGTRIAELRRSLFGGIVCKPMPGVTANHKSGAQPVANGGRIELTSGQTVYDYRLEILSRRSSNTDKRAGTATGGYY